MNEQDKAVAEYLEAQGVTFAVALVGETKRDSWACDEWRVLFDKRAQSGGRNAEYSVPYYIGTGHRKPQRKSWDKTPRPVAPTAASVLHGLLLDASAGDDSFADWCDNYGYDTDSRKALETYLACQETAQKLAQLFTAEQRATLSTMLEDY